jgi:hypothetical protein
MTKQQHHLARVLVIELLRGYRLKSDEYDQEYARIIGAIEQAVGAEMESLAHRAKETTA